MMEPDAHKSSDQTDPASTNPRSKKWDLRHNLEPNCNDDFRYYTLYLI